MGPELGRELIGIGQKLTGNMWHARVTPKNMLHNC